MTVAFREQELPNEDSHHLFLDRDLYVASAVLALQVYDSREQTILQQHLQWKDEFIYMEDVFRTRLRVAKSDDFIVKTRNTTDQVRLKPGEKIEIGWSPSWCSALDAESINI